jgi:transposase
MARYKPYNYAQTVMLPVSLESQLVPGSLEFAIHTLVDSRIKVDAFERKYKNDETGCPAYDPRLLLKIILLAYSRGIISSRQIERACRENVTFMAISCCKYPDHTTIATFVSSMQEEIKIVFRDILLVCEELKLLGGTSFALDGLKLCSNASKEWSGTIENLKKKREKIQQKIEAIMQQQLEADQKEEPNHAETSSEHKQKVENQIKKLQAKADKIQQWLAENQPKIGQKGEEIQSNITDNESAKMMTSHGVIQGYNGQALVDNKHQVIVHAEAFGNGQDYAHLTPMIDGAKENVQAIGLPENYFEGKRLTADPNYHSEGNLKKCAEEKLDAYIPDVKFRQRDPRFAAQDKYKPVKAKKFKLPDFAYDAEKDCYVCPNGKVLRLEARQAKTREHIFRRYVSKVEDCADCSLRTQCLKRKGAQQKHLIIDLRRLTPSLSEEMIKKIDTAAGGQKYGERLGIVEPVFANIRTQKRMDRFTLRSKIKVNIQWVLYCVVHNIEKAVNFGEMGKLIPHVA